MKFDKTLLPDEIVTLEQLAGWVIAELSSRSVSVRYREIENRIPERVEKFGPIFFYLNLPEAAPCLGYRVRCHPVRVFILLPIIWYSRPILGDTKFGESVDSSFSWWASLEGWIISGEWKPINSMVVAPEEFIRGYFSDINNRNTSKAWNSLSPKFQNNKRLMPNGYDSYKEWWRDTVEQVKVTNVNTQERTFNSAKMKVDWIYQLAGESDFSEQTFILDLILDTRSGRWLIDESNSLK